MNGLELTHNDQTVKASIENGVTSVFLSKIDGIFRLDFRGLDVNAGQYITWLESMADPGDEIRVKVVDVTESSDVILATPQSRNTPQDKLAEYKRLKRYLEKEGLI